MGDLISKKQAINFLKTLAYEPDMSCEAATAVCMAWGGIDRMPVVDAVPVVRCKDCEEYIPWLDGKICGLIGSYFGNTKPNDFCSRGIRKKAGE